MNWFPTPLVLLYSSIRPMRRHREHIAGPAGSRSRIIGLQIQVFKASTIREIDAAFATLGRERPDALFVGPDGFFSSRRVQFAILAARDRIPATFDAT